MRDRLWFRLHHVRPLAQHTLACVEHRLTGAQAQSRTAHGPALVWTRTTAGDQLVSNGIPGWYDRDGATHAAPAFTWRAVPGTHQHGRPGDYTSAYLPLTDGRLVDLLDLAAMTGRNWVVIDIDPADGHLIGTRRIQVMASRHDLVPAGTGWIPATITCRDVGDRPYPAVIADGYTSGSGALLARFDTPTVQCMSDDLARLHANPDRTTDAMPGEYPRLHLCGDGELVVLEQRDTGDDVIWQISDRVTRDGDGLYPLGAYLWPWRLISR